MIACRAIEIARRNQPPFVELALVPAAPFDPRPRRDLHRLLADASTDVLDALDGGKTEIEDKEALRTAVGEMRVRIEEAGRDGTSPEIDLFGRGSDVGADLLVGAD